MPRRPPLRAAVVAAASRCWRRGAADCARTDAERRPGAGRRGRAPELGACRDLTPDDVAPAEQRHQDRRLRRASTPRETYAVGALPAELEDAAYDDRGARRVRLPDLLGEVREVPRRRREPGDAHRGQLGVVPPVGEGLGRGRALVPLRRRRRRRQTTEFVDLPDDRQGPAARPARTTSGWSAPHGPVGRRRRRRSPARRHTWRAVTTIKLGEPEDPYPGDRLVEVTTRDFCSDSVGAWLELPRRLRLRLHLVPRGRVGGRQPPLGLLGEDGPVTRRRSRLRPSCVSVLVAARHLAVLAAPAGARPGAPSRRPARATRRARGRPAGRRRRRRGPTPTACYRLVVRRRRRPDDPRASRCPAPASAHRTDLPRRRRSTRVVDGHLLAVDSAPGPPARSPTDCPRRFAAYVGGDRASRGG